MYKMRQYNDAVDNRQPYFNSNKMAETARDTEAKCSKFDRRVERLTKKIEVFEACRGLKDFENATKILP